MSKLPVVSPVGLIPDTRTAANSGVGLTEVAMQPSDRVRPNHGGPIASMGMAMIAAYPGGHRSTHIQSNWLNDPKYGKK